MTVGAPEKGRGSARRIPEFKMSHYKNMSTDSLKKDLIDKLDRLHVSDALYARKDTGRVERLMHELEVMQIAFEMQKRELCEARQSLKEARARYCELYDTAPVGYASIDDRGCIQEINISCAAMLGIVRSQMEGMPFTLFVHRDDVEAFRAHLQRCRQTSEKVTTELKLKGRGGSAIPVELTSKALQKGQNIVYRSTITEIVQLKRAQDEAALLKQELAEGKLVEQGLRDYRNRLEAAINSSDDLVFFKNTEFKYLAVNRKFEDLFNTKAEDIIGRTDFDFMDRDLAEASRSSDEDVLKANGQVDREEEVRGRRFHIVKKRVYDPERSISGIAGIIRDVTGKAEREEEILKARELESLGLLAAGIAHDFNNLLTGVLGNASLGKMYADRDSRVYKLLTDIEQVSLRAKDITQQLLTFATGGTPVKSRAPIEVILKDSEFAVRGGNTRCEFSIADDLWPIEADEGQLRQVINNLVINADQAMPEGGVISIRADNAEVSEKDGLPLRKGRYVRITVEDQGAGIPKEHLHKIFDPYFTTKQKGSGLGLAIAYSIMKRHDGYIGVESEPGKGTAFRIYLPALRIEDYRN